MARRQHGNDPDRVRIAELAARKIERSIHAGRIRRRDTASLDTPIALSELDGAVLDSLPSGLKPGDRLAPSRSRRWHRASASARSQARWRSASGRTASTCPRTTSIGLLSRWRSRAPSCAPSTTSADVIAGREALAQVIAALSETFDAAKRTIDDGIGQAASGVSERVEAVMGGVLGRLEAQVSSFQSGLAGFQDGMAAKIEQTQAAVAAAQSSGAETVAIVAAQTAAALRDGLGDALQAIAGEVERFTRAMRATQESIQAQVGTVRDAPAQARTASDAFAKIAQDVRLAATPLVQSGQRVAEAAESFNHGVATAASSLEQGRITSSRLAEHVQGLAERIAQQWSSHAERFAGVDKYLAKPRPHPRRH